MTRSLLCLIYLGCLSVPVVAQSVRWQPAGGNLDRGQTTELVLIFENCVPQGEVKIPQIENLVISPPHTSTQSQQTFINGQRNLVEYHLLAYPAIPGKEDTVAIPSFAVQTDKGEFRLPRVQYGVREATVNDTSIPVSQVAHSELKLGPDEIWAGEVVSIDYTLNVSARFRANLGGEPNWDSTPMVVEEWQEPSRSSEGAGSAARNLLNYPTRGLINAPGTYAIPSVQQLVNIGIPTAGFLSSMRAEQYAITSDSPQVVVRPLPSSFPAGFEGAVGQFTLTSKVVPQTAEVGEPVTWTLTLEGTGNWPDIPGLPKRSVSRSFRVVQPDAVREIPVGKLFDGSINEDVILIPVQAGEFQLGPVSWSYFDPRQDRYQTITAPGTTLTVTSAAAPAPSLSGSDVRSDSSLDSPSAVRAEPAPDSPAAIPRDPLPGHASGLRPWSQMQVVIAGAVIVALFPLLWLCLSWRRARLLDPGRAARSARRRLPGRITTIDGAVDHERSLLAWQKDAATLWQSEQAAPSADLFAGDESWTQLWLEADQVLYGDNGELPEDWTQRARHCLQSKRAPRFPFWRMLAARHLFPAIVLLGLMAGPSDTTAQGLAAYREGNYPAAEQAWREAIAINHNDWIAHHNLALALAQQNRWNEAGGHAAVAFAQNPRDPSTRWHLEYTLTRSGYTPPVLGAFLTPHWEQRIARFASPAEWQVIFVAGLSLGVFSLMLILFHAYGFKLRAWKPLVWSGGLIAVFTMASAIFSLQTWGIVRDANAALTWQTGQLRSIPTDLDSAQQMAPLAAGSLARVDKAFLGWRQISFPNGQTGWIRQEEVLGIWQER